MRSGAVPSVWQLIAYGSAAATEAVRCGLIPADVNTMMSEEEPEEDPDAEPMEWLNVCCLMAHLPQPQIALLPCAHTPFQVAKGGSLALYKDTGAQTLQVEHDTCTH